MNPEDGTLRRIETELLDALRTLEAAVTRTGAGDAATPLTPLFARLDTLAATLPPSAPRDLRHYLGMKSYEKARRWLERELGEAPATTG